MSTTATLKRKKSVRRKFQIPSEEVVQTLPWVRFDSKAKCQNPTKFKYKKGIAFQNGKAVARYMLNAGIFREFYIRPGIGKWFVDVANGCEYLNIVGVVAMTKRVEAVRWRLMDSLKRVHKLEDVAEQQVVAAMKAKNIRGYKTTIDGRSSIVTYVQKSVYPRGKKPEYWVEVEREEEESEPHLLETLGNLHTEGKIEACLEKWIAARDVRKSRISKSNNVEDLLRQLVRALTFGRSAELGRTIYTINGRQYDGTASDRWPDKADETFNLDVEE
jgi:hypothetical protein